MNNTNSSSGVSSVPTSTVKPALIDVKLREDETSLSTGASPNMITKLVREGPPRININIASVTVAGFLF